jgi:acetamidase/formamidase
MPHFTTPAVNASRMAAVTEECYTTTGVGPDLRECTRMAVREMIAHLGAAHGLSREDAYMLCSIAGDLRIMEVVDVPNFVVSATKYLLCLCRKDIDMKKVGMMMPLSIFGYKK